MVEHQEYFGRRFYKDKKRGYWFSTNSPRIYAHRWVWINLHGAIPKGYHIHHKNENKSDNGIENLELIEAARHLRHHITPLKILQWRKNIVKAQEKAKQWHGSAEGIAWHRLHAIKCKFGKNDPIDYTCDHCSKSFKSSKLSRTRFCTNACKSAWRRNQKIDNIDRKCEKCERLFNTNKYSKQKFCARKCPINAPID